MNNEFLIGNENIEQAISNMAADKSKENFVALCKVIRERMNSNGHILVPIEIPNDTKAELDEKINKGDVAKVDGAINFIIRKMKTHDGQTVLAIFTTREQASKGVSTSVVSESIQKFFKAVSQMKDIDGIVINPYDTSFFLSQNLIKTILEFGN